MVAVVACGGLWWLVGVCDGGLWWFVMVVCGGGNGGGF